MKTRRIKIAISQIADGNLDFRWGKRDEIVANRKRFLSKNGILFESCVAMKADELGSEIKEVSVDHKGRGMLKIDPLMACDGLFTNEFGVGLFLLVADCYPVAMYDLKRNLLGLVHLGRRGVDSGLVTKLCEIFKKNGSNLAEVLVFSGPGIKKDSYLWAGEFPHKQSRWGNFLELNAEGLWKIDIEGFLVKQFLDKGILRENIQVSPIDVFKDKNYYSHARSVKTGETEGRFAMVVTMLELPG